VVGCQASPTPKRAQTQPTFAGLAESPASGWPTYQRDLSRSGSDPSFPVVHTLRRDWTSSTLDGAVYSQPLVVGNRLIVATENDSVYSLDALTGRPIWKRTLGKPMPGAALPCGNIDPSGITGTPVVDEQLGVLYAVAFVQPGRHQLAAIDLAKGSLIYQRTVDPPTANPLIEQQRPALALSHSTVYIAFGGLFGDCGQYHGWVVGAPEDGEGALLTYQVPSKRQGGIWAPSGPSVDAGGDVYVATGNSAGSILGVGETFDFGNAVIRLSGDLHLLDWWAPSNWASLNSTDTDLGSVGPALLSDGRLFQIGKQGIGYLLHPGHLGGINGPAFSSQVCAAAFGAIAYAASYIYVACAEGLVAVRLNGFSFRVAWRSPSFSPGPPIVAGGMVWAIDTAGGVLYGLDPSGGQVRQRVSVGAVEHFAASSAGDRRVFVPADRSVLAFTES